MSSINNITISGRLGRDPETRETGSGKTVCSFSVAVDRRGKDAGTDWFQVTAWERLGELCQEFLAKGRHVTISGRMQSRQYEKDGQKVTAWDLVANDIDFGPRVDSAPEQYAPAPQPQRQRPAPQGNRPSGKLGPRQVVEQSWGPIKDEVPF